MGTSILHLLPYTVTLQDEAEATGNGTEMDLHGKYGSLTVQVFGTFVGTITFEARVTDKSPSDWVAVPATNRVTGAKATTATAAGLYSVNVAEYKAFRARVSAYTSGAIYAVATAIPSAHSTDAVSINGSNAQVGADGTATWAAEAAANTEDDVDLTLPSTLQADALYMIVVCNPSAVTALTGKLKILCNALAASDRYAEVKGGRFSITANSTEAVLVQGWMLGNGARLTLSNDTALGAGEGFSATVRVLKV